MGLLDRVKLALTPVDRIEDPDVEVRVPSEDELKEQYPEDPPNDPQPDELDDQ